MKSLTQKLAHYLFDGNVPPDAISTTHNGLRICIDEHYFDIHQDYTLTIHVSLSQHNGDYVNAWHGNNENDLYNTITNTLDSHKAIQNAVKDLMNL